MGEIRFTTELQRRGPAAAVILDDEQVAVVGEGAKRFPVVATVQGHTWRTTVTRMGGEHLLGLNRAVRDAAGVEAGDVVDVVVALDTAPREVEVPEDLAAAMAAADGTRERFDALAVSHRKEYVRWVTEAKRDETRQRRITQAVEMIQAGRTRS